MSEEHRRRRRRRRRASRDEDLDSEDRERLHQHYGPPSEHSNDPSKELSSSEHPKDPSKELSSSEHPKDASTELPPSKHSKDPSKELPPSKHSKDPSKELSWWYLSWCSCITTSKELWYLCHAGFRSFVALVTGPSSCVSWPMAIIIVGFAIIIVAVTIGYIAHRWFNMTEAAGMMLVNALAIAWGGVSSGIGMVADFATPSSDTAPPLHEWHLKPVLPTVDLLIPGLRALQRDLDVVNVEYQLSENLMVPLRALKELDEEINMEYDKTRKAFDSVRHQLHEIIHKPKTEPTVPNAPFYKQFFQWNRPSDILRKRGKEVVSALGNLHAAHGNHHKLITDDILAQMGSVATDVCETASRIQKLDEKATSSDDPSVLGIKKDATMVAWNYCQSIKRKRAELRDTEQQLVKDHRATAALLSNAEQFLAKVEDKTDLQEKAIRRLENEYQQIARKGLDSMRKFYETHEA